MIPIPQTVVYKGTVMVKVLHTLVADGAVEGCLRLDDLTVRAEIVEMQANFKGLLD